MFTYVHKSDLDHYKQYAPQVIGDYRPNDAAILGWIMFNFPGLKGMPWNYGNQINMPNKYFVGASKIANYNPVTEEKHYLTTAIIIEVEDTGRDIGFNVHLEGEIGVTFYHARDDILDKLSPVDELYDDAGPSYDNASMWRELCRRNNQKYHSQAGE